MKVIFYKTYILLHRTLFVCFAGPTLNQHWINDLCFTGKNTLKITKRNYPNVTALLDRLLRCWPNITSPDLVFLIFVSRDIPIINFARTIFESRGDYRKIFMKKYYVVQKLDLLTCSKFEITTSLYKPIKLGKLKFVFSPEFQYMPDSLKF